MFRFMTATTFLLAVLFYQASGGNDFEPWQRDTPDYVIASPDPWDAPKPRAGGKSFFASSANASEAPEGVQLASISGQNDAGLDPALTGLDYASVTPASLPAAEAGSAETSHATRGMQPEAQEALGLSGAEREAVLRGTIPAAVTEAAQPEADLRRVTGDRVNLRAGPGTLHQILGTLDQGTRVEVIGADDGWLHLRLPENGQTGWMADWLVSARR